jgi:hypothetical protein
MRRKVFRTAELLSEQGQDDRDDLPGLALSLPLSTPLLDDKLLQIG